MSVRKEIYRIVDRSTISIGQPSFALCLSLKCLLIAFTCFASAAAAQQSLPAGVEIRIQAQPQTAAIGDRIQIDLDITTPVGYRIEILEPEQKTDDFFILEFLPGTAVTDTTKPEKQTQEIESQDAASQRHQARIVAAIFKTGTFTFPGIPIFITDSEGRKTEIQSPSVDVEIQSILTENSQDLRDLKKQADIPEKIRWLFWTLIFVTTFILGTAAWFIQRKYRKQPLSIPAIPEQNPFDLAESELNDLITRKLPENGHTKKFYILLSEIVKRILEAAYEIHTAERTTIEIMDSLHRDNNHKQDRLEKIESLLLQCDVVKFAKYIPSKTENDTAAESAFLILSEAREYVGRRGEPCVRPL